MLLLNALALTTSALQDINRLKDMLLPPTLSKSLFSSSVSPSLMEKNEVQVIKGTRYYETNEPSKGNFFMKGNRIPLIIGGVLLVAIFTAFIVQLVQHLRHFHRPQMQKGYIRIIAITPIYAVTSYMVLLEPEIKGIIAVFRVCFEGYVMYIFAVLMVLFCGGQISVKKRLNRMLLKNPRSLRYWIFPCLPVYTFSSVKTAWRAWTWSLFQFLTIRPFVAVIAGYYEREHSIIQGDIIFLSIQVTTVTIAMAGLLNFYMHLSMPAFNSPPLKLFKPANKFLALKMAIFFTVYQEVTFHLLVGSGMIDSFFCQEETALVALETHSHTGLHSLQGNDPPVNCHRDIPEQGIRTFALITIIEMACFAVFHIFVFPHTDASLAYVRNSIDVPASASVRVNYRHSVLPPSLDARDRDNRGRGNCSNDSIDNISRDNDLRRSRSHGCNDHAGDYISMMGHNTISSGPQPKFIHQQQQQQQQKQQFNRSGNNLDCNHYDHKNRAHLRPADSIDKADGKVDSNLNSIDNHLSPNPDSSSANDNHTPLYVPLSGSHVVAVASSPSSISPQLLPSSSLRDVNARVREQNEHLRQQQAREENIYVYEEDDDSGHDSEDSDGGDGAGDDAGLAVSETLLASATRKLSPRDQFVDFSWSNLCFALNCFDGFTDMWEDDFKMYEKHNGAGESSENASSREGCDVDDTRIGTGHDGPSIGDNDTGVDNERNGHLNVNINGDECDDNSNTSCGDNDKDVLDSSCNDEDCEYDHDKSDDSAELNALCNQLYKHDTDSDAIDDTQRSSVP